MTISEKNEIPTHIGFIMNGNRTWAAREKRDLKEGYLAGSDTLLSTIGNCLKHGIKYMTVYAFSTENWRRPEEQKDLLMLLFKKGVEERIDELVRDGVRLRFIGRKDDFPSSVKKAFGMAEKLTAGGNKLTLNVAVSYGGRAEIVDATKKIIKEGVDPNDVTEEKFSEYIYEAGQPDPELIIRTGGETRLSGFMLWQSTYSELYFTKTLWPDFNDKEFVRALEFYKSVKRNFGK
ncbi:MAG: polyprenyl diphosphate synthase [Patescibacteria group bacterium]|nr:polyprenyl diphosphate synthase [Patescibacteria group bacterium]